MDCNWSDSFSCPLFVFVCHDSLVDKSNQLFEPEMPLVVGREGTVRQFGS